MRFAFPLSPARALRLFGNPDDWPMALRLAAVIVPAGICMALAATWLGYNAARGSLADSLESLPLLEAKVQAERMNDAYTNLRRSLERIAQLPRINAQDVQPELELFFQDGYPLLGEFGLYNKEGKSFMLLRDGDSFREINLESTASRDYFAFQQITTLPLTPGKAIIFPAVFTYHPSRDDKERPRKVPVIRMALPLADGSGALVVGIDIDALQKQIGIYSREGSPLHSPLQRGALQVSYFFDPDGWILFEMTGSESSGFFPDLARRGYTGDLGRQGYDAAFRPWGVHEDYWRMITEVKENRSGSSPATAEHYSSTHAQSRAFLCYSPVYFYPSESASPQLIGGIAFFETSSLPLAAFLRVANASLFVVLGAFVLTWFVVLRAGRRLSLPLSSLALQMKSMNENGEFHALEANPVCTEQQRLLAAANSLISRAMVAQTGMERLQREMQVARARSPVDLAQLVARRPESSEFDLVGSSALISEVREHMRKAARAGTDVLIWGETGTGKELVAAGIHKASARKDGPYISINCGALDETLLLDTLFGHVKGAFTEAKTDRKGAFLSADGGTLHLDEIANASAKVQQALLRALSVRRIRPLGSDIEVSFNTRVVAATNVDLRECVRAGTFREDLYYRLAIISIETPPLRHRKEDIPELAAFCIHEAAISMGQPEARLSRGALELMSAHDWPGNVRELKNCLTRAMAFVEDDLILPQHIVLGQDAFRVYGKPVQAQMLAGKLTAADFQTPATGPVLPKKGFFAGKKAKPNGGASEKDAKNKPDGQFSPMGMGHAAEYLWPVPPRERFTPVRPEAASSKKKPTEEGGGAPESVNGVSENVAAQAGGMESEQTQEQNPRPDGFSPPLPLLEGEQPSSFALPPSSSRNSGQSAEHTASYVVPHSFHDSGQIADSDMREHLGDDFAETQPGLTEGVVLNERQQRALEFLRSHGRITRAQYESVAGQELSARTAQNDLKELVNLGILERVGAGPGVRYTLRRQTGEA